jgi:hypothetical protein
MWFITSDIARENECKCARSNKLWKIEGSTYHLFFKLSKPANVLFYSAFQQWRSSVLSPFIGTG